MRLIPLFFNFILLFPYVLSSNYYILVSGSKGNIDIRHQKSIYALYSYLASNGVSTDNIISFCYNNYNATSYDYFHEKYLWVKTGSNKTNFTFDYQKENVTLDNFIYELNGKGKMGKITLNDNIIVYFNGNGGDSVLGFPNNDLLYSNVFIDVLINLKKTINYRKILIIIDSSYSGSFALPLLNENLTDILFITSSKWNEATFSINCFTSKNKENCSSNEFTALFINFLNHVNNNKITLNNAFSEIKKEMKFSTPEIIIHETNNDYLSDYFPIIQNNLKDDVKVLAHNNYKTSSIKNTEFKLAYYINFDEIYTIPPSESFFHKELFLNIKTENFFEALIEIYSLPFQRDITKPINFVCLSQVINEYKSSCVFDLSRDAKYITHFISLCSMRNNNSTIQLSNHIRNICFNL